MMLAGTLEHVALDGESTSCPQNASEAFLTLHYINKAVVTLRCQAKVQGQGRLDRVKSELGFKIPKKSPHEMLLLQ